MLRVNKIIARLLSTPFGFDQFGNEYRIGKYKNYLGKHKRFVIYNGLDNGSKVPPEWHAWLHYLTNDKPQQTPQAELSWQKSFEPNLTGTKFAYHPTTDDNTMPIYKHWKP